MKKLTIASVIAALALVVSAQAESSVKLSNLHLCCNSCVKGVEKAAGTVSGATVAVDKDGGTATITAADKATVQKTVDAIISAGYFGTPSDDGFKATASYGADGKVSSLKVEGVHLCCKKCVKGVNAALEGVSGYKSTDAVEKQTSFTITGDVSPKEVMAALNKAGFAGTVAK
jgi:copper chaperone CopZ